MSGHGGNDTLIGGTGNDAINGGTGNDRLQGRDGHSVWYVKQAGGVLVRRDLNGNKTAGFEIWVDDARRLGATDFII